MSRPLLHLLSCHQRSTFPLTDSHIEPSLSLLVLQQNLPLLSFPLKKLQSDQTENEEAEDDEAEEDGDDDDPDSHTTRGDVWTVLGGVDRNIGIVVKLLQHLLQLGDTEPGEGGNAEDLLTDVVREEVAPDGDGGAVLVGEKRKWSTADLDTVGPGHRAVEVEAEGRARSGRSWL